MKGPGDRCHLRAGGGSAARAVRGVARAGRGGGWFPAEFQSARVPGGRSPRTGRNRRAQGLASHAGAVRCHVLRCIPQLGPKASPRNQVGAPGAADTSQRGGRPRAGLRWLHQLGGRRRRRR